MSAPRVLTSTTSHKTEPLLPTLEVFARLGLRDIDLNLHHILEVGTPVRSIVDAVTAHDLRVWVVSGGWCDFFHRAPQIEETFESVAHQVEIARQLGVAQLRLFFGRLKNEEYSPSHFETIRENLSCLSDQHPNVSFMFENHDGVSLRPDVCRDILARVNRPNIRMNFDPINFERVGVSALGALDIVRPFIGHLHLKGLKDGEYCEFGAGDVDLEPMLRSLLEHGYRGGFSVEYEGPHDGTLRLYESVRLARSVIEELSTT